MTNHLWSQVDDYIESHVSANDEILETVLHNCEAAGLPAINVAPNQGKLLMLLAHSIKAKRILEVGTLGGYSTIWLARALTHGGHVVTLELDSHHAEVAEKNIRIAGLADRVEILIGPALETLKLMSTDHGEPFDLIFIDADKENNVAYFEQALRLSRPGSIIIIDNVVRDGTVIQSDSEDSRVQGVRRFFERVAVEPSVIMTAIQTVGSKGYDGFAIMLVTG